MLMFRTKIMGGIKKKNVYNNGGMWLMSGYKELLIILIFKKKCKITKVKLNVCTYFLTENKHENKHVL